MVVVFFFVVGEVGIFVSWDFRVFVDIGEVDGIWDFLWLRFLEFFVCWGRVDVVVYGIFFRLEILVYYGDRRLRR